MSDSDSGAGGQAEATSSPSKILNEVSDAVQNMDVLGVEGFELTAVEMDTLRSLQMRMKVTMRKSKDQLENFLKSSERGEIIRRRANSVSETVKDVKDQVKFRAHDVSEQVKTRANEAKEKVKVRAKDAQEKVTRRVRQVVTGDGDKRVRDEVTRHVRKAVTGDSDKRVREWIKDPPVVKAIDKFSFALGIFLLVATQYVFLVHPHRFHYYYGTTLTLMMAIRFHTYGGKGWARFMLDFCYAVNLSTVINAVFYPDNRMLWVANYGMSNVLLLAVVIWRNSLVFHSLDKVTSLFIHFMPPLVCYNARWSAGTPMCPPDAEGNRVDHCSLDFFDGYILPLQFYAMWQLLYWFKTELVDRALLVSDKNIQTSLRWFVRDPRNPLVRAVHKKCIAWGLMPAGEPMDPDKLVTKLVYAASQLVVTLIAVAPTCLNFQYVNLNAAWVLLAFASVTYNGSNFYFENFAVRYQKKLQARAAEIASADDGVLRGEGHSVSNGAANVVGGGGESSGSGSSSAGSCAGEEGGAVMEGEDESSRMSAETAKKTE